MNEEIKNLQQLLDEAEVIETLDEKSLDDQFFPDSDSFEILDESSDKLKGVKLPVAENREMVVYAKIGQAGKVNRNRRVYPLEIMKREVGRLNEKIQRREVFSNDQHPRRELSEDKKSVKLVDLPNWGSTTFIPYALEMNEQGEIFSLGVIPKTTSGTNFANVIRAGGNPGFSTRGAGSLQKKKISVNEGKEMEVLVAQDNFRLINFDTVIDQSVADANIRSLTESEKDSSLENATSISEQSEESQNGQTQKTIVESNYNQIMKFSQWIKKHPEAYGDLSEAIESGIKLEDFKSNFGPLYEAIHDAVVADVDQQVQENLYEKYEAYLKSIHEELTENELKELKIDALVDFCEAIGLSEETAKALMEQDQFNFEELFKTFLEEMAASTGEDTEGAETDQTNESQQESEEIDMNQLEEAFGESITNNPIIKQLVENQNQLSEQLATSKKNETIMRLRSEFAYGNKLFDENVKPLMDEADDAETVTAIYENQVAFLKAAKVKEVPRGQSRFVSPEAGIEQLMEGDEPEGQSGDLGTDLINEAAESFKSAEDIEDTEGSRPLTKA